MKAKGRLTTAEVLKRYGLTNRRVSYWVGRGYFPTMTRVGSGYHYIWGPVEIARLEEILGALARAQSILREAGLTAHLRALDRTAATGPVQSLQKVAS